MGKEVDGMLIDEKGVFKLLEVKLGVYDIKFLFLGF